jgi:hypothetical protein
MDSAMRIPGTSIRLGADAVLGLIPGVGDALASVISTYVILQAAKMGAHKTLLSRMLLNVVIDSVVGAVPVIGDLFDIGWKANIKNVELLRTSVAERRMGPARNSSDLGRLMNWAAVLGLLIVFGVPLLLLVLLIAALF